MKLSELKQMVAEEYTRYLAEQPGDAAGAPPLPMPPPMPAGGPAISVSDDDIQMGEDPEQMLRNIYDMLKAHFEAEEMAAGAPPMPGGPGAPPPPPPPPPAPDMGGDMGDDMDEPVDFDADEDEEEEETIDENSTKDSAYQKTGYKPFAKKTHGTSAPYGKAGKKSTKNAGYDAGSKSLQEVKRMQKLANLIK